MRTFAIDIDNTLLISKAKRCNHCGRYTYTFIRPISNHVHKVNLLYDAGNNIFLYTGRGWDYYDETVKQLERCGIKYHELIMGKPIGIYVDVDKVTFDDIFREEKGDR